MSQGFTKGTPIDTDPTLSLDSDIVVPSQSAVKAYVASQVGTPVTDVTATAPLISSSGTTPNLSIPAATTSVDGYLTSTDWDTFNDKQATITGAATTITTSDLTVNKALVSNASGKVAASSSVVGYNLATLTDPSAISYIRIKADNTVDTRTPSQVLTDLGIAGTIVLNKNFTDTAAITGTTTPTIIFSVLIPANTLQANDWITSRVFSKTTGTGGTNFNVYINTSASIPGGGTVIGQWAAAANTAGLFERNFMMTASGVSGSLKFFPNTALSAYTAGNFTTASITVNTTVDQYLIFVAANGAVTASATTNGNVITILR